jgi:hypothetical protein
VLKASFLERESLLLRTLPDCFLEGSPGTF